MDALPPLTPFDPARMIESLDEQGRGLRVVFFRPPAAADRWGHAVATVFNAGDAEETIAPRLISQEGPGPDSWPLSPPLQSLSIERRPSGAVALLVGMSGQSHWSASFEAVAGHGIVVDIACRVAKGSTEPRLGSHYLAQHWQALGLKIGPEIAMKTSPGNIFLEVQATTQQPVRWKYTIELADLTTKS
jgi:hypothetical protein